MNSAPLARTVVLESAERIVGWTLLGAEGIADATAEISRVATRFPEPLNRIARAATRIIDRGLSVSPASVSLAMGGDPGLAQLGGQEYLIALARAAPALAHADDLKVQCQRHLATIEAASAGSLENLSAVQLLTSAEFVRGFKPPNYLIDGIIQTGYLYSFTGMTGSGKTAITLLLMALIALGKGLGSHATLQTRCLMLCGENPDDVRARWIALSEQLCFDTSTIDAHFLPGIFPLDDIESVIASRARDLGGVGLVIIDTSAAYFEGGDENSNTEAGAHARKLRLLTQIAGNPTVIVNCHPVKNAGPENLIPRGGGAFIAEVDGNLCCRKDETAVQLHWQGKFRGPDFAPVFFDLQTISSQLLKDTGGRLMPTVVARVLTESEQQKREGADDREQRRLLSALRDDPGASISDLAVAMAWYLSDGKAHKTKVVRRLDQLDKQGLVAKELDTWVITPKGRRVIDKGAA